jgi:hypothetical protein
VNYRRWISPDLTPLDFYFWGYVKQTVYSVRIPNIQRLKQRIREVAASVTPDVLGRMWQEMEYSLDVCRATNGTHNRTSINTWKKLFELFFNLIHI